MTAKITTERAAATVKRWRNDASAFVREALSAEPEPWQALALDAIAKHDRLAIRSGHGVGKSAFLAWLILWFLLTRFPAKVAATAPTAHQLNDVLWGEVAKWARRLPIPLREQLDVKAEKVEVAGARTESFAVARTARKEQPEALRQIHFECPQHDTGAAVAAVDRRNRSMARRSSTPIRRRISHSAMRARDWQEVATRLQEAAAATFLSAMPRAGQAIPSDMKRSTHRFICTYIYVCRR